MKQAKEIKQNRTGTENFDICLCVIFDLSHQSIFSGKETGHYILSPPTLQIF